MSQITVTVVVYIMTFAANITQSVSTSGWPPVHVQLTSAHQNRSFCPGEEVIFTCEVRGSATLAWRTRHFEYTFGLIEFNILDPINTTLNIASRNIVATLISTTNDVMVSELRIIVQSQDSQFLEFDVTCINVAYFIKATIVNLVLADAAAPQIGESSLRSGINGSCVAQLSWSAPGNIDIKDVSHYEVKFRRMPIANGTIDTNEDLSAINSGCNCNSTYEFSVYAVNRCGRPGASNTTILDPPKFSHTLPVCDTQATLSSDANTTDSEATGTTQIEQRKRWSGKMMVTNARNRAIQHDRFIFSFSFLCGDCSTGCSWRVKN